VLARDVVPGTRQLKDRALEADMGLLDILNSIQTGGADPRAQSAPTSQGTSQGMSPIAKALLGLLAMYAAKNMSRAAPSQPTGNPSGELDGGPAGGLGDILGSVLGGGATGRSGPAGGAGGLGDILGGLLGGAGAGAALNGGLGDLLKQFQQNGQGDVARSWVGTGPNKAISPHDLGSALGGDTLDTLAEQTGMARGALLNGLSQHLPRFVDQLTPDGRLPTHEEAARMV
jgi:uncharacterized protein YidB (DUF937 family)